MAEPTTQNNKKMVQHIVPLSMAYSLFGDDICAIMSTLDEPSIQNIVNLLSRMDDKVKDSHYKQAMTTLFLESRDKLSANVIINRECNGLSFANSWSEVRNIIAMAGKIDWSADPVVDTVKAISELVINRLINVSFIKKSKPTDKDYVAAAEKDIQKILCIVSDSMNKCGRDKLKYLTKLRTLMDSGNPKKKGTKRAKKEDGTSSDEKKEEPSADTMDE